VSDTPRTLEWRLCHLDGSVITVEATISPMPDPALTVVLLKDVTRERAVQRALEEREHFIEKIAAVMPASLRAFDVERDVYLFNNHRIAAILGLTTEEVGTVTPQKLIEARVHPDDQTVLFANRRQLTESPDGTVVETLYRARHTDGSWRWIRAYDVVLARDEQGGVRQIVGVGVDVTEQQETLEKLRERERLLAGIATAIPASVRAYDLKHNIFIYNNNRIAHILGLTEAEVQSRKPLELAERIHPDDKMRLFSTSQRLITEPDGTVVQMLYRLRHEDGDYRWLQGYDVVMSRDAEGQVEQIVGIAVDMTEQKRAEEALLERERFIAGIAAAIPASLRVYDHERRAAVYNNGRLRRILGLETGFDDALIHQRLHPDDHFKLEATLDQLQRSADGVVVETLYRLQHISGDYIWIHAYDMVMSRDTHGGLKEVIGIDVDVTAEQFMLEALMESEERLQLALTSAYDGWWEWNDADDSMLLSPSLMTMLGLLSNGESISTQRWIERVYTDDQRLLREVWLDALRDKLPVIDVEYRIQNWSGEWKWIQVRGKVVTRSAEGRALRVIGTVTDVTERKQSEAALRESEARYRLIAENVNDLISRHTIRGDYLYASPACRMLLGYEPEYLIGRRVYDLIHPEDIEHALDAQFRAMNSDEPVITNFRMRHRSGAYIWFETTSRSVRDTLTGDAVEWVCVARDVTMRLQAQEEMLRAERMRIEIEQQREVIDLKQNFVTMVSHEFRTPLAVIMTSTEMMERYQAQMSTARRGEHLKVIQTQALHMTQMMEDVLLLSRAQAGKLPFKPAPLDVLALCHQVIDHLLLRDGEAARVQFTYALPAVEYVLDEKLIQQILVNLLTNALKYSRDVVELNVREDGALLHITVRDYGIGIPEIDQQHLYETFHRGANVGTITGTGLGLSIVKYSVERHGGTINFHSEQDAGTTFIVRIPLG
jgi:PAS domain S-box-containing protein